MNNAKQQKIILLPALLSISGVAYYLLGYQIERENALHVISLYFSLFTLYFLLFKYFSFRYFLILLSSAIVFRLLLLFSVPNLSDDVYRFIWDGRLAANGVNPFSYVPADIIQMQPVTGISTELFAQLNSPNYFTIYPPVMQAIFFAAGKLFPVNIYAAIVFLKVIVVLVEIASIFLIIEILKLVNKPKQVCLLYALNPLIITELTGNVHFEGVMIFFVLLAVFLLFKMQWKTSALMIGFGIGTKLLPVLFIPLIINKLGWRKGILYTAASCLTAVVLFALLIDLNSIHHLLKSVDLFFRHFEFNASLYYVVRWIGTIVKGYNIIAFAGPLLIAAVSGLIWIISFKKKQSDHKIFTNFMFIITIWFMFSTTVHPWYICMPVAFAVFTPYLYAYVWSFTATLSYAAYQYNPVQENLWLISCGYIIVYVFAFLEWRKKGSLYNNTR